VSARYEEMKGVARHYLETLEDAALCVREEKPRYAHFVGRWDNFLLGCVNCNSTKLDKDVELLVDVALLVGAVLPERAVHLVDHLREAHRGVRVGMMKGMIRR
jgi:hypothetical protein